MAKDYIRKRQVNSRSNAPKRFFLMLISFLVGYITATIFDITTLTTWLNKHILLHNEPSQALKVMAKKDPVPKPKLEFYTLLSRDNSAPVISHQTQIDSAKAALAVTSQQPSVAQLAALKAAAQMSKEPEAKTGGSNPLLTKDFFIIQVASFPKRQDAEHMQANLVLKGFDVNITTINQNNVIWYRVLIGPFAKRSDAEKIQSILARNERMNGMIRKMTS